MIISSYVFVGCILLIIVALFDKDDDGDLNNYQLAITCISIVLFWPMMIHLIFKDIKTK